MTVYYVSKAGSDASDGLSWATAKKTLTATAALMTGTDDTMNIGAGVYAESVQMPIGSNKTSRFSGYGRVVWDGGSTFCVNRSADPWPIEVDGITFRGTGWSLDIFAGGSGADWSGTARNCVFLAPPRLQNRGLIDFSRCVFHCGSLPLSNSAVHIRTFQNCTFIQTPIVNRGGHFSQCLFKLATGEYLPVNSTGDYNAFDGVSATQTIGGQTSLAAWQAASGQDAHSIVSAGQIADATNDVYSLNIDSPLVFAAEYGESIGACPGADVLSPTLNSADWNAPESNAGLEQDGNGHWLLSNAGSGQLTTAVRDLGQSKLIRKVTPSVDMGPTGEVLDTTTGDRLLTMEFRHSATSFAAGDAVPAWQTIDLDQDLNTNCRYWQARITLRTNGDS